MFYGQSNTETNFAWAVYGGLSYDVTPGLSIDLTYRYTDLGDTNFQSVAANSQDYASVKFHAVRAGISYKF